MHSPFLYFPHDRLSPAELTAACLDGHLVELGEGYLPADAVETAVMRAASLRSLLGERFAIALTSAAWVWGAIPHAPERHSLCRAVERRVPMLVSRRAVLHDLALAPGDLADLAGVPVTTPARTLDDLARRAGASERRAARGLVETGIVTIAEATERLRARGRQPAARRAREFLAALERDQSRIEDDQAEVTR